MALQCNMSLNVSTCVAGATPAPQATLTVYNPNATAVAVTAIQVAYYNGLTGAPLNGAVAPQVPAASPGMTVVVPALSSITFGPMPVAAALPGSANSFWASSPIAGAALVNPQLGLPPQLPLLVGATVYGSDGSANEAGRAGLTVSYSPFPPPSYQGGYLQFSSGNNLITGVAAGVV
jgi:hypothetical protein